ncbi:MAG: bifunctional (p)ppGpp synthetase/guanosine-3',5'-bis(diphosphate) 3'-pyrophosphohydrolase [Magnetococcales bacterium]|nr:bifunctional (p)ppGpp synthetase/guanosine-3',5'-bis(diphosphate) 3'-pyrophosphohydrolase [Magnetococcales bacterium]MBF0148886.1 bifunctional (p)ppGpp synthetase/guanosine-3',5'-bis(diphosphate) 3'-pyrophosphohydrolase [Magnetococcales bacterium]MBF0172957.1 bifunctional (p)ppGpp synthetase/guanosine-3',5'-bis(diphosphate) 3'-pyrophosphohydrolase [Magnetococcales bacterium]MBF0347334.1 bifunctional (p)ppGpp synthetase/guanosine-3',5'-bis(diphosphate) 3'-pyrophosphohydrolase [Magnetococcales 
MSTLEKALALAARYHEGQVDRSGQPYILHPLRLMMQLDDPSHQMIALLHDVVEDTPITLKDLEREGFSESVLSVVDLLTHRAEDSYEDYIARLKPNRVARKIKLLDLIDNMDVRRLDHVPDERDWARMQRYQRAWATLNDLPSV